MRFFRLVQHRGSLCRVMTIEQEEEEEEEEEKKELALHEVRIKFHELSRGSACPESGTYVFGEAMLLVWPQDGLELPI
ncbi:hypothetical protein QLX08_006240 [Tetragonisca angustula]|uniref:Uncharacterized protein n=1 Tax=Tetragonisca angustula TaxID=166442 RepID=A0AAW0ZUT4_9HYME